jgi:prophage regulatory protein
MLKIKKVLKMTGLSRSSIYAYIEKGKFPKQVRLGVRSVAWIEEEVVAWLDARIAERDACHSSHY